VTPVLKSIKRLADEQQGNKGSLEPKTVEAKAHRSELAMARQTRQLPSRARGRRRRASDSGGARLCKRVPELRKDEVNTVVLSIWPRMARLRRRGQADQGCLMAVKGRRRKTTAGSGL
jgi:hypothetical protein